MSLPIVLGVVGCDGSESGKNGETGESDASHANSTSAEQTLINTNSPDEVRSEQDGSGGQRPNDGTSARSSDDGRSGA